MKSNNKVNYSWLTDHTPQIFNELSLQIDLDLTISKGAVISLEGDIECEQIYINHVFPGSMVEASTIFFDFDNDSMYISTNDLIAHLRMAVDLKNAINRKKTTTNGRNTGSLHFANFG